MALALALALALFASLDKHTTTSVESKNPHHKPKQHKINNKKKQKQKKQPATTSPNPNSKRTMASKDSSNRPLSRILTLLTHATAAKESTNSGGLNRKGVTDIDVVGKRVLIRVDFNVPRDKATGLCVTLMVLFHRHLVVNITLVVVVHVLQGKSRILSALTPHCQRSNMSSSMERNLLCSCPTLGVRKGKWSQNSALRGLSTPLFRKQSAER